MGVDGSASNDGSHLLAEARQAMLISRVGTVTAPEINGQKELLTARQVLEMATRGGAAVLGREDIGSLEPGKCADFIAIDLNRVEFAGGLHDPVASVIFCASVPVDFNYVHGNPVVVESRLVTSDLEDLIEAHNQSADRLVNGG